MSPLGYSICNTWSVGWDRFILKYNNMRDKFKLIQFVNIIYQS